MRIRAVNGVRVGILLALAFAAARCAPTTGTSGPLQPLVVGTEQHVTIDWQPERSDQPAVVWGYVNNKSPYTFDRVRVLVEALGPAGEINGQQLVWAPGLLGGWGRTYFEARMGPAHAYRVRVFSYDRVESDRGRRVPF
jgi:hypothetical protein